MMIRSLRLKFTLWYIGSVSFLFLVFSTIIFLKFQNILTDNIDSVLLKGTTFLGAPLSEYKIGKNGDPRSLYEIKSGGTELLVHEFEYEVQEVFTSNAAFVELRKCRGDEAPSEIIFKTKNLKEKTLPVFLNPCAGSSNTTDEIRTDDIRTVEGVFAFPVRQVGIKVYDFDKNPYLLQVAISFQEVPQTINRIVLFAALFFPFMLSIFTIFGFFFMKKVFRPIRETVKQTNGISASNLSERLMVTSRDEIGDLSITINQLIERLERSFSQTKQFSEDAAHELKTPISKLKCNAEITLRQARSKAEYQTAIDSMLEDINGLEDVTEKLLQLSRMDLQKNPRSFEQFPFHELVMTVFEDAHQSAHQKELFLDFGQLDGVEIYADKGLIQSMMVNLISNAIKYTPHGGHIKLNLQKTNSHVVLTITDNGVGIPEDALPFIFDRFFRVDQSRSLETGGTGLGLSLVQKIVEFHGGKIDVKSSPGTGSSFFVTLPCIA